MEINPSPINGYSDIRLPVSAKVNKHAETAKSLLKAQTSAKQIAKQIRAIKSAPQEEQNKVIRSIAGKIISKSKQSSTDEILKSLTDLLGENDETLPFIIEAVEAALAGRLSKQVDKTIDNLLLLKKSVPDLVLDETLMGQLENIKRSVASNQDLQGQRLALKGIISQIGEAVKLWESDTSGARFNIDEENMEGGNKHARLIEMASYFQEKPMPGVVVPYPRAILNGQVHAFIDEAAPVVKKQWGQLQDLYQQHQESKKPAFEFLQQPQVQQILFDINRSITEAFSKEKLDMPEEFWQWIGQHQENDRYLMVRSSGSEDSRTSANAGGNVSVAYVAPEAKAVCAAIGEVVASYFSEGSLQNRLNTNENPFSTPLSLDVTTQELIGEPIGGAKDPSKIPVSIVMFTNEPTYTGNEKFRVMRISATYGHGEGVVGAAGVRSDTILILRSVKHPDRLYILENNQVKPKRLAPMRDETTGKITLQKLDNSKEKAEKPSLDHRLLTRLYYAGVAVEKAYGGHPMDMELIFEDGLINSVQARPINRPPSNPTYFDMRKAKSEAVVEQFQAEAFLPGRAKTKILTKPDEILIADSLEKAEKLFKKGVHKLVIVKEEEPANSHPVVNFSGMGIPVMYHEKSHEVAALAAKIGNGKVLIACPQSGNLVLLDSSKMDPKDCISPGYTVHPAKVALSVASGPLPKTSATVTEIPQEIKNATMKIRAFEVEAEAINALKDFKSQITEQRESLAGKIANNPHAPERAKELESGLGKLEKAFKRSISEAKALQKQPGENRLQNLLHAKVIEQLMTQAENPRALGQLSVVNARAQMDEVEKIFAYQEKFDFPTVFHEEILASSACMTKDQEAKWETFLIKTENDLHAGNITMEQAEAFKDLLKTTKDLDLLPMWMIRFFQPLGSSQGLPQLLDSFTPETKAIIQEMHSIAGQMQVLEDNLNLFSDTATFDKAFTQLMELHAKLACVNDDLKNQLQGAEPLGRIAAYQVMGNFVALYDSAIKSMKASPHISQEKKVELFTRMLNPYYGLLKGWSEKLSGPLLQYHKDWPLVDYLRQLKSQLDKTGNGVSELSPSGGFRVYSAILGSVTAFERALPSTKEDVFTLVHQNLLASLNALLGSEMKEKTSLPPLLERASQAAEGISKLSMGKHFERTDESPLLPVQLVGYSFPPGQVVLHYNYPLRNHSATFSLTFDKASQDCQINVNFVGQARARYPIMNHVMQFLDSIGHVKLMTTPEMTNMELSYSLKLPDEKSINAALVEIQKQARLTLVANYEYFYDKLCDWVEEEYGQDKVLDNLDKLDVPELSEPTTSYLYQKVLEETDPDKAWNLCIKLLSLANPRKSHYEGRYFTDVLEETASVLSKKIPDNIEEQLKEIALSKSSDKLNLRVLFKFRPSIIPKETIANILFDPEIIPKNDGSDIWDIRYWKLYVSMLLKEKEGLEHARRLFENPDTSPEIKSFLQGFL